MRLIAKTAQRCLNLVQNASLRRACYKTASGTGRNKSLEEEDPWTPLLARRVGETGLFQAQVNCAIFSLDPAGVPN